MKIALQYVNDANGNTQAVQMPLREWEKVLNQLKKCEHALKLRSDLKEAFEQISLVKQSKERKQTLNGFLADL